MTHVRHALLLTAAALAVGCGGEKKPALDPAPFKAALEEHLRTGSMDMKPDAFETIQVRGDEATAKVRMATKDDLYGMKPTWTVTFERTDKGWRVRDIRR
ncbi:MAG TPA: hypothetical protein PLE19_07525 [Planctomycetota bacterium]|nr:hypothetical protein [Planctomycetota bacterium]HRR80163.1 hypothetical protein [Planctomycetota bacterium]HRT94281.1 hypothetical protein [Planctomycetota bacterium]